MQALMNPRSIAVIGASQRGNRGSRVLANLRQAGFAGRVAAINPNYASVEGFPCFPSVGAVGETIDCVVVAIPAARVPTALEEAYAAGTRGAVVLSSGFGEGGHGDSDGLTRVRHLAASGMSICGPNCFGVYNMRTGAAAFSGRMPSETLLGPVSVISQSGGFTHVILDPLLNDRKVGFSYLVSCGNQIGVSVEDYIGYLVEDDGTKVVAAFVEGFRDPAKLLSAGEAARRRGKPVVVMKVGRSRVGMAAAMSHTGSLAGSPEILDALLDRAGIIQTATIDELCETVCLFANIPPTPQAPREIVVLTGSGGEGTHAADAAESAGLSFAPLPAAAGELLRARLPDFAGISNPIDGTGAMIDSPELFPELVEGILPEFSGNPILINLVGRSPATATMRGFAKVIAEYARKSSGTIVTYGCSALGPVDIELASTLREAGVPYLAGTHNTMLAVAHYQAYCARLSGNGEADADRGVTKPGITGGAGILPFLEAKQLLESYGIRVVDSRLAHTAEEAASAADAVGYPVAMKLEAAGLAHKTDVGGVVLGVSSRAAVDEAFQGLLRAARTAGIAAKASVIVQPMIKPVAEVFAGVISDDVLGPAVVLGLGGIYVEVFRQTVVEIPPISRERASAAVKRLKGVQLLTGARGQAPADVEAITRLLSALGDLARDNADVIRAIDLNPVMVQASGGDAVVVDAMIELRS